MALPRDPALQAFEEACVAAARDLKLLPREVKKDLGRVAKEQIAAPLAVKVTAAATGPWARALVARPRAAADPTIVVGGTRRVFSHGATPRDVVFGTEFGGGNRIQVFWSTRKNARFRGDGTRKPYRKHVTRQFIRNKHPFVYPTVLENLDFVVDRFGDVVADTAQRQGF